MKTAPLTVKILHSLTTQHTRAGLSRSAPPSACSVCRLLTKLPGSVLKPKHFERAVRKKDELWKAKC